MRKLGWLPLALLAAAALAPSPGSAATEAVKATDPLRAEAARLQQALAKHAHAPDWKDTAPRIADALAAARKDFDAGYLYRGLEELGTAHVLLRFGELSDAVPEAPTMSQFEADWRRSQIDLAAVDRGARAARWTARPAALRALAETATARAQGLYTASRPYAVATRPADGMNVLAQAKGQADLSRFFASTVLPRPGEPLPLRSVAPELRQLQRQVDDAFKPPRSIELHPQFIRLNATLKTAGELDAAHLFAGALYQYLDGVEQLAVLDSAPPDAAAQARLRATLASQLAEVARSRRDDSILRLFLERAETAIPGGTGGIGGGGAAPNPDGWKQAAAIVERVVPAYRAALAGAPPGVETAESKLAAGGVTVTLVRWPFT